MNTLILLVRCLLVVNMCVLSLFMKCPSNYSMCGVLTIETGLGHGVYNNKEVGVHGLWPQVSPYGTSM